ncbi:hypothetical protein [Mesorhizobium sp. M1322]|uniref:hypothetical protein n=1 Tax=Mesorhizobium sp. M1322 TaxID=2957081 RepID=UPI0033393719
MVQAVASDQLPIVAPPAKLPICRGKASKRTWLSTLNTRRLSRGVFRDGFVYLDEQNHSDLAARRQQGFLIFSCGVISFSQFSYNAACVARDHAVIREPHFSYNRSRLT